jgi:hypothetical protein
VDEVRGILVEIVGAAMLVIVDYNKLKTQSDYV